MIYQVRKLVKLAERMELKLALAEASRFEQEAKRLYDKYITSKNYKAIKDGEKEARQYLTNLYGRDDTYGKLFSFVNNQRTDINNYQKLKELYQNKIINQINSVPVEVVPRYEIDEGGRGTESTYSAKENKIKIAYDPSYEDGWEEYNPEQHKQTLVHELSHAIFNYLIINNIIDENKYKNITSDMNAEPSVSSKIKDRGYIYNPDEQRSRMLQLISEYKLIDNHSSNISEQKLLQILRSQLGYSFEPTNMPGMYKIQSNDRGKPFSSNPNDQFNLTLVAYLIKTDSENGKNYSIFNLGKLAQAFSQVAAVTTKGKSDSAYA